MAEYIEREAAIDALTERNLVVHMDSVNDGLVASCHRSAQRIIANIPAADVRPRWIPVTERLPEEGEFVLVYGDLYPNKHDGGVIAVSKRMDWNYWQGFGREIDITHWMPLPSTEGLNET